MLKLWRGPGVNCLGGGGQLFRKRVRGGNSLGEGAGVNCLGRGGREKVIVWGEGARGSCLGEGAGGNCFGGGGGRMVIILGEEAGGVVVLGEVPGVNCLGDFMLFAYLTLKLAPEFF